MELLITVIVIALVIQGLERNRQRQSTPHLHLAGSSDIQDRDTERFNCELLSRG
jgi:hypothetical protein